MWTVPELNVIRSHICGKVTLSVFVVCTTNLVHIKYCCLLSSDTQLRYSRGSVIRSLFLVGCARGQMLGASGSRGFSRQSRWHSGCSRQALVCSRQAPGPESGGGIQPVRGLLRRILTGPETSWGGLVRYAVRSRSSEHKWSHSCRVISTMQPFKPVTMRHFGIAAL
jgi:hypothetical protein